MRKIYKTNKLLKGGRIPKLAYGSDYNPNEDIDNADGSNRLPYVDVNGNYNIDYSRLGTNVDNIGNLSSAINNTIQKPTVLKDGLKGVSNGMSIGKVIGKTVSGISGATAIGGTTAAIGGTAAAIGGSSAAIGGTAAMLGGTAAAVGGTAAAGALAGTAIPIPVLGTIAGAVVGAGVGIGKSISKRNQLRDKAKRDAENEYNQNIAFDMAQQKRTRANIIDSNLHNKYTGYGVTSMFQSAYGGKLGLDGRAGEHIIPRTGITSSLENRILNKTQQKTFNKYLDIYSPNNILDIEKNLIDFNKNYNVKKDYPALKEGQKVVYDTFNNKFPNANNPNWYVKSFSKAFGGNMNRLASGGVIPDENSQDIDNSAELVTNEQGGTSGSHEQGDNIPVTNGGGQEVAQVEPGEVVVKLADGSDFALSKRLGFAQKYLELTKYKEQVQHNISGSDYYKRNESDRIISKLDKQLADLPAKQEMMKKQLGIDNDTMSAFGGNLSRRKNLLLRTPDGRRSMPTLESELEGGNYRFNKRGKIMYNGGLFDQYGNELDENGNPIVGIANSRNENSLYKTFASTSPNANNLIHPSSIVEPYPTMQSKDIYGRNKSYNDNGIYPTMKAKGFNTTPIPLKIEGNFNDPPANSYNSDSSISKNRLLTRNTLNKIGTGIENMSPMIDNAVNSILISKTPAETNPRLNQYPLLETKVDDSAKINDINEEVATANENIDSSVSDAQVAFAMKQKVREAAIQQLNAVHEATSNTERGLRNTNVLYKNNTDIANNALLDNYDVRKRNRLVGILDDKSANAANLETDITGMLNRRDMKNYQKMQLDIERSNYGDNGIWTNNMKLGVYDDVIKNETDAKAVYDTLPDKHHKDEFRQRAEIVLGTKLYKWLTIS